MANTNHFSGIVKILETPKDYFVKDQISVTRFRVEVSQKRKTTTIISLVFWGNLGREVQKFYKIDDYILIEGYISTRPKQNLNPNRKNSKQVIITVLRVYPVLLNSDRAFRKI